MSYSAVPRVARPYLDGLLLSLACATSFAGCYAGHGHEPSPGGPDGAPPGALDASGTGSAEAGMRLDASVDAAPRRLWDAEVHELDPDAALDFDAAGMHSCHERTIFLPVDRPGCVSIEVSGADVRECESGGGRGDDEPLVLGGQPVTILNLVAKHLGIVVDFLGAPGCHGTGCMFLQRDTAETCDCGGGGRSSMGDASMPRYGLYVTGMARSQSAYSLVVGGAQSRWRINACVRD
ncbi:MAG: hypothetical protein KF729_15380 [Sandaracinaceae bacterium]|nr:hypothetical protein [Sandaracinaceae bacterium]